MTQSRLRYVDVLRGIAILCIVFGHMGIAAIDRVVFTFHVPVFFMISGYFFSNRGGFGALAAKRAKSLLRPYVLTCIAIIIVAVLIDLVNNGAGENLLTTAGRWVIASLYGIGTYPVAPSGIQPIGMLWFLLASFIAALAFKGLLRLKAPLRIFLVALLVVACCISSRYFLLPWSIQAAGLGLMYMCLGALWKRQKPYIDGGSRRLKLAFAAVAVAGWLLTIYFYKGIYIVEAFFGNGALDILGTLCASYSVLLIAKGIDGGCSWLARPLAFLGKNSLAVLCAHAVESSLFHWGAIAAALVGLGVPQLLALAIAFACKMLWIIGLTIIYACIKGKRQG